MKNPLNRRIPRELKNEFTKYLVVFLLLMFMIGFISGFLVADGSMIYTYNESFSKYTVENGHFVTREKLNRSQKNRIEDFGVRIHELFYVTKKTEKGQTLKIYRNRKRINRVCLMEGKLPKGKNEIAVDRMFADNNSIKIGDEIRADRTYTVVGTVAFSDYSSMFENNTDPMFDSIKFSVALVDDSTFKSYRESSLTYCYAWLYDNEPSDEKAENDVSQDLLEKITEIAEIDEFVPRFENQAIKFTGEDLGSDRAMMMVLLYILIAIIAFVFAVTISNTITRESAVIGTLRASGYTERELIRHYMILPVLVTLLAAVLGNILGYTFFKSITIGLYYNSYSLPEYTTVWNGWAFLYTTVVPVLMMTLINYLMLRYKMKLSPLKFLRRDLRRKQKQRVFPLSRKLDFFSRFRIRVIIQNRGNYLVLLIGILFANLLLLFGLGLPDVLDNYQKNIEQNLLADYQYILKFPQEVMGGESSLDSMLEMMKFSFQVETDNPDAEKFCAYTLNTAYIDYPSAEIMIYGIENSSRYVPLSLGEKGVFISSGYADKYSIRKGETIKLKEKYEDDEYEFTVAGIYDYDASLAVFMSRDMFAKTFDVGQDFFSGYLSESRITDIDEKYIGSVLDLEALTKLSRQLDVSMGGMMRMVQVMALIIFMIVIYLLSKIIIEKNAPSISMAKILGYSNREISKLYIFPTTIMVTVFILVSIPVVYFSFMAIYRPMMIQMMAGWLPLDLSPIIYVKMILMGIATYSVVAFMEYTRVKKIPMDEALKNVE